MINNVAFMLERGYLKKPFYIWFVLGILGAAPEPCKTSFSSTGPPRTLSANSSGRSAPSGIIKLTCTPPPCLWAVTSGWG
ncbi:hypothetical protein GFC01_00130 [Desulfofundulus thermobenzoicus]|uniref:Uncharacterized protein n=1 Tax=Desulfofundulus thermobenzoicus TaxID=29376 RepID=A0A6N7IM11_9FIRM|nr:hypothetical protein [Desulfofundulus thermobenzoicus]